MCLLNKIRADKILFQQQLYNFQRLKLSLVSFSEVSSNNNVLYLLIRKNVIPAKKHHIFVYKVALSSTARIINKWDWLKIYPLWSVSLCFNWRPLVPTYFFPHFLHVSMSTMVNDSQFTFLPMFLVVLASILTVFPLLNNWACCTALATFTNPIYYSFCIGQGATFVFF